MSDGAVWLLQSSYGTLSVHRTREGAQSAMTPERLAYPSRRRQFTDLEWRRETQTRWRLWARRIDDADLSEMPYRVMRKEILP